MNINDTYRHIINSDENSLMLIRQMYDENLQPHLFQIHNNSQALALCISFYDRLLPEKQNIRLQIMQEFLNHGADINRQNTSGNTALHLLAHSNFNVELFQLLHFHGASLNIKNNHGYNILLYATKNNNIELIKYLIS